MGPRRNAVGIQGSETVAVTTDRHSYQALSDHDRGRALFDGAPDPTVVLGQDGSLLDANQAAVALGGYSLAELLAMTAEEFFGRAELEASPLRFTSAAAGQALATLRPLVRKDGSVVPVDIRMTRLASGFVLAVIRDATALVAERDALEEAQAMTLVGSWMHDIEAGTLEWSTEAYRIFGVDLEENGPSPAAFYRKIHPEDFDMVRAYLDRAVVDGAGYEFDHRIVRDAGRIRVVHERGEVIVDELNRPVRIVGTVQDVTELRGAETSLSESSERLRRARRMARMGEWVWDVYGRGVTFSGELAGVFGVESRVVDAGAFAQGVHRDDRERVVAARDQILIDQLPYEIDYRAVIAGGQVLDLHEWVEVARSDERGVLAVMGALQDLTPLREAERLVERQRDELAEAQALAHVGSWTRDIKAGTLEWSDEVYRIFGVDPKDPLMSPEVFFARVHPDDDETVREQVGRSLADGSTYELDHRIVRDDGEVRVVHERGEVLVGGSGEPDRMVGTVQDVTELRSAERAAVETAARLESITSTSVVGLYRLSTDMELLWSNDAAAKIEGRNFKDLWGEGQTGKAVHPEDRERVLAAFAAAREAAEGLRLTHRFLHEDGTVVWVLAELAPELNADGERVGYIGSLVDITEQKRAEEEATLFNRVIEQSLNEIYLFDGETLRFVNVNYGARANLGYTMEELRNLTPLDLKPAFTLESFAELVEPLQAGSREMVTFSTVHRRKDGTQYPVEVHLQLVAAGAPVFVALILDITERVRAEQAAAEAADELQKRLVAIEQFDEMIVLTDTEAKITYVNPAFERTTGYSRSEAIGQNPRILKSGQQLPEVYEDLWTTIRGGETWRGRFVDAAKDGSLFTADVTISPVFSESKEPLGYVQITRNVTKQLELEKGLVEAQRLESIGRLAGGIAHDFNNLLTVVMGSAEMIRFEADDGQPAVELADEIVKAAIRGSELVDQLLTFSGRQTLGVGDFDIGTAVIEATTLLRRMVGGSVAITTNVEDDLPLVMMNRSQFDQILMNLVVNARDALPAGGQIALELSGVDIDVEERRGGWKLESGSYVRMRVMDNGSGMDADTTARIFEPFFTTKDMGKGTGLGLATVHGIVAQSGGCIEVASAVGRGTTFTIHLPGVRASTEVPVV